MILRAIKNASLCLFKIDERPEKFEERRQEQSEQLRNLENLFKMRMRLDKRISSC